MVSVAGTHEISWPEHGVKMTFRLIPPGEFEMGSRAEFWDSRLEPRHRVRITQPFWLGETPVTQDLFDIWKRAAGVWHVHAFNGQPKNPADNLSWQHAIRFCSWLERGKRDELPPGFPLVCLPTEAEWEYACRARTDTAYYTGDGEDDLADAGWYSRNSKETTHPVGQKLENKFQLRDIHGNVWEWCHDEWDEEAYRRREDGVKDPGSLERLEGWRAGLPTMLESSLQRVQRGGSWGDRAAECHSAYRIRWRPGDRDRFSGFRVCLARGPAAGRGAPRTARVEAEP
jgi:formylglycine-generating enzyme required for sulfatase activity